MNGENCHLCGAWAEDGGRFQKRNFLHCSACDLVFVPAAEQVSADQAKARYWRQRNTPEDAGYVATLSAVVELLHAQSPTARRVLDYGSGPAPVLMELLREAGHEAAGYDPHFASDTAMTPPFDAVTAVETFEHFAEPRREVERILGLLRPDGCLLVQTLLHAGLGRFADWWYARGP
jgi:SAM-dependent methyltransferase